MYRDRDPSALGPTPPPLCVSGHSHRPFSGLSTGPEASYAFRPVDNWHRQGAGLYNLCITTYRLNIMDTVEHRIGLLLWLIPSRARVRTYRKSLRKAPNR
jgi:hypothetical protein